ncbi:MAG: hypothetical protein AAB019_07075 [Planctomycetota bacterium]
MKEYLIIDIILRLNMIKDTNLLNEFEQAYLKSEKLTYEQALKLFESLWQEAKALGVIPLKEPLEGIETDIRLARILNNR